MKNFKNVLAVVLFLMGATLFAQTNLTGKVVDDYNQPLPGADVIVKGTTQGTSTDFDGNFNLDTSNASGTVTISFIGYTPKNLAFTGSKDFGTIQLEASSESLDEVVIVGIADIAKDRETPVAVSTIKASEIVERLGSQELPEILNATPSVYATKSGGGFGDSRINIRGFDQRNTAVMINGMPVNDMENGWVYWSNWAGLSDVTTAMQVQRGLGSSKLAISSVGGTINVLTRTADAREGGAVSATYGNDNYLKTVASYNTGVMDSGFSTSILLGRSAGDGYVDGTQFEGYNYFLGFGYQKDNQSVQLTITGAPQTHNQRTTSFYNMATLEDYLTYGAKYNYNHGYLNGEEFNWRKNFYHKPIASLNWDWDISESSKLNTVLYASVGRGGGTGDIGRLPGYKFASDPIFRDDNGEVRWDDIVSYNQGNEVIFSDGNSYQRTDMTEDGYINDSKDNGLTRRASMNSHNWYGAIVNFNHELNENLTFDIGADVRSYKGIHYRRLDNLLGADGYIDSDNANQPDNFLTTTYDSDLSSMLNVFGKTEDEEKIDYYNDGLVRWYGAFGQLEYKNETVSAFVQAGGSQQGFKRIDYFTYEDSDPEQETDWENILGGNVKAGLNVNLTENHNIFANAGYYSKQPLFDAVYINYVNELNTDYRNEKVIGAEVGYGFRSERANVKLNLYRTSWADRFITVDAENDTGDEGTANMSGVEQIHMGAELEVNYRPLENFRLKAMASLGNWEYAGSPTGKAYDSDQNFIEDVTLYLDGVKVGDAAQFTSRIGFEWDMLKNLSFDLYQSYADKLYADINAEDFDEPDHDGSLRLPGYSLTNAGLSFKIKLKDKMGVNLRLNVNNLFDTEYLSESATNYHVSDYTDNTWNGIDTGNKVFFGFGRTWNTSLRFTF